LANDTRKTIRKTWKIWETISLINQTGKGKATVQHAFGPMILLDPGALAFDFPRNYGYRLIFKNLEDYIKGMSLPSWHQWISYETKFLNRDLIADLIIDCMEYSINLKERYGFYSKYEADIGRLWFVTVNKLAVGVVNDAMSLHDEDEKMKRLRSFREFLDSKLREMSAPS
jgi:hypothetical protein